MPKTVRKETLHAAGIDIGIYTTDFKNEFISLTDIARYRSIDPRITIHNWLRGRDIVEFLGLWEVLHNPDFKRIEFDTFKKDAGTNAFVVMQMVLRDLKYCTNHHRYGYSEELEYNKDLGKMPYKAKNPTFYNIADRIYAAALTYDRLARLFYSGYEDRSGSFFAIWDCYDRCSNL